MSHLRHIAWVLALLLAVIVPGLADAGVFKHSGTILAVDEKAGTIVLGEIGPWRVQQGVTEVTRLTIAVTPSTDFVLVKRAQESTSGFPGDFVEMPFSAGNLADGDFVTVECLHEGPRRVALRITVTDVKQP